MSTPTPERQLEIINESAETFLNLYRDCEDQISEYFCEESFEYLEEEEADFSNKVASLIFKEIEDYINSGRYRERVIAALMQKEEDDATNRDEYRKRVHCPLCGQNGVQGHKPGCKGLPFP